MIERLDRLLGPPMADWGAHGRRDQLSHAFLESELDSLRVDGPDQFR